jgi:small-conductance mechanosensitive channel
VGYLAGNFTYQMLSTYLGETAGVIVPRLAQILVVVVAIVTGLAQMSVEVTFIAVTIIAILVTTLGTLGLAFALGSRDYVAGLLARRAFSQFSIGDRVRMDDLEGTIVEFTDRSVMIQSDEGIAVVPASVFASAIVVRKTS